MKIKEIVEIESKNIDSIILLREGLFWRAYEKSAYHFTRNVKQFRPIKKFIKAINSEVVYLGLPNNSLKTILKLADNKKVDQNKQKIVISSFDFKENDYRLWKNNIVSTEKNTQPQDTTKTVSNPTAGIIDQIRSFPVMTKSPLDSQLFIINLQSQINGSL